MSSNAETVSEMNSMEEIEINIQDDKGEAAVETSTIDITKNPQPITPLEEARPSIANAKPEDVVRSIENKPINELSDIERAVIVANAKNGIDMPFFDVKFFGNGKYRIVKKKPVKPSTAQKVIKASVSNSPDIKDPDRKVYYTNDQLLMEHIIELNSKVDKLMTKHKKLKRKYQSVSADIYVEDNEESHNEQPNEQLCHDDDDRGEPINEQPKNILPINDMKYIRQRSLSRSWRNQLNYL